MLFNLAVGHERRVARRAEPTFDFLKHSGLPTCRRIKSVLNDWILRYPPEGKVHLAKRLTKDEFESAFFELFLHELLLRFGACVDLHPAVGTEGKRPDFKVTFPDGFEAIIEACTLLGDKVDDQNARYQPILDEIDRRLPRGDFWLGFVELHVAKGCNPPLAKICNFLIGQLGKLDRALPPSKWTNMHLEYRDDNCVMTFYVIPKPLEILDQDDGRVIVAESSGARWGTRTNYLKDRLTEKAKRYGPLRCPYLIAVNDNLPWGLEDRDLQAALTGERQEYVPVGTEEVKVRYLDSGLWGTLGDPRHTTVSGVVFARFCRGT